MIKLFTLFLSFTVAASAWSQRILVDNFNYQAGTLTDLGDNRSGGLWINSSGTGNLLTVTEGSLTYPNYFTGPTPTSGKVTLTGLSGSSEDAYTSFEKKISGTLYGSFLTKVNRISNLAPNVHPTIDGEHYVGFLPTANTNDYRARVFMRKGSQPNTVNFGINVTSTSSTPPLNPVVWAPTNYDSGVVHLVTFAYQFNGGLGADRAKLWINKPFSATEPTPDAISIFPMSGSIPADLGRLAIRQGTTLTPNVDIDAMIVSTNYSDVSLPLNLTSFTGSLLNKAVVLNWSSSNEVNVKGFAIEKGLNGKDFSEVGFTAAKNTATANDYSFEDNSVKGGPNYYRLKMIDKDGSSRFSNVVLINSTIVSGVSVFPNPAVGNINLSHEKATRGAVISVVGLNGKVLKTYPVQPGATQTGLSVAEMVKGNYILIFNNNGSKSVTQFSKQ